jgi:hypothetical protein
MITTKRLTPEIATWRVGVVLAFVTALAGCVQRRQLTQAVLDHQVTRTNSDANRVRLYVNRKLVVTRKDIREAGRRIRGDIEVLGRKKTLHEIIGRLAPGRLVAIDNVNDQTRLWIAFDDECAATACAFAFVAGEGGEEFQLSAVPGNPIYDQLEIHGRDWAISRELTRGYIASLSEPNQVYRGRSYRDKVITVHLQFIERRKARKINIKRKRGVEGQPRPIELVSGRDPKG